MPLLTAAGLVGATVTVAATTVDDAIWLVPYVVASHNQQQQPWSMSARVTHAVVFVATLESLALVSVVVARIIIASSSSHHNNNKQDRDITDDDDSESILLGVIAALLCWALALFFYIKKVLKRRRRKRQRQDEERIGLATAAGGGGGATTDDYGSAPPTAVTSDPSAPVSSASLVHSEAPQHQQPKSLSSSSIGTVISLTTLGALDELSYFPALLVGKIFTPLEICIGTLLAAIAILIVVVWCLAKCQPLVDCLDRIPIYAVISIFATVLTLGVLYDVITTRTSGEE